MPDEFSTEIELRALMSPLLDAVAVLHDEQCFHRDISPENIIIRPNGAPVLLDFGAARRILGDSTAALTVVPEAELRADRAVLRRRRARARPLDGHLRARRGDVRGDHAQAAALRGRARLPGPGEAARKGRAGGIHAAIPAAASTPAWR
jgi:serine/threonine protein kinase